MIKHVAVMPAEILENLRIVRGKTYVDATFGRGGHSKRILELGGKVIALDCDETAIQYGEENFKDELKNKQLTLIRSNFAELETAVNKGLKNLGSNKISGILFDFGASTDQLKDEKRGFSFDSDAELDMRMDKRLKVKAKDLLNALSDRELSKLFFNLGGENKARIIAKAIVKQRKQGLKIESTKQLANLICQVKARTGKLHPATKIFQALRIAVNDELNNIKVALPQAFNILDTGGRIVTISFHEGEDRLVKLFCKKMQEKNLAELINQKPLTASQTEINQNPNSRSAKLRVIEKL